MDESLLQRVSELGSRLIQLTRPNKDSLVKLLRQVVSSISDIEQPSVSQAAKKEHAVKVTQAALDPLRNSIVKHDLLKHKDKEVRLFVAICVSEMFRILAPEPPFEDKYLRDVFILILSTFTELADTASPYFSKRVKILEIIARCRCCVIMLDIDCHDLVHDMFRTFFSIVRDRQQSLFGDIVFLMTTIIKEETSQHLVDVILRNLLKEGMGNASAASGLAFSLIQSCSVNLEPFVCGFLASCFVDRDSVQSDLKDSYHNIIFRIFQCAPQMLLTVTPNLTHELLTDQVDVRLKAVNLIGKMCAIREHRVAEMYPDIFAEFLKRFSDKSAEVRISALQRAKECYLANPSGMEVSEFLTAIKERLLDIDDKVRTQAVIVACDLTKANFKFVPAELITEASERLRDKKVSVRKKALQKLLEVYQEYCIKCSVGHMTISDHLEQVPCKILMLCFEKDCQEFRPQSMELVLAEDLFPASLTVEEKMRHWVYMSTLFNHLHLKSLHSILSHKRRLQTKMKLYLSLRDKKELNSLEDMQNQFTSLFTQISESFPDPSKAEECFHKLNQINDNGIFSLLAQILDEPRVTHAQKIRVEFLKMIGDKHPQFEFLCLLSSRCLCNIFSSEHVSQLFSNGSANKKLENSAVELLLAIIGMFPMYLRGSEEQFLNHVEEESTAAELQILAKAIPHISANFRDFYPFLKRMCLEGSRGHSKYAVTAIASLIGSSEQFVFSELWKELVDSLERGQNIPTILQSLGCISQYSVSAFEDRDGGIRSYILGHIFQAQPSDDLDSYHENAACCYSCKLKIYGLKTLVKSFLPYHGQPTRKIDELMKILLTMLKQDELYDDIILCERDQDHIRLAAAKCVLQLSKRWDFHISPEIFRLTISISKDFSFRKSFLYKVHKLLKEHIIPSRYACAFAFATGDCLKDLQDDSYRFMKEFVKDYNKKAQTHQISTEQGVPITEYPVYIVVYLIHVLAHDSSFPSEDCVDEHIYARFCCPLFAALQTLVNISICEGDVNFLGSTVVWLLQIFHAIKRTEDALNAEKTQKLHFLADFGITAATALNLTGISSPRITGQILLPSTMYKIRVVKQSNKDHLETHTPITSEKTFSQKVIQILESWTSLVDLPIGKVVENNKMSERREAGIGFGRKRALHPTAPNSIALTKNCSTIRECKKGSSKISKPIREKEISYSSSVNIRPSSTVSELPIGRSERNSACLKGNGAASFINAECTKVNEASVMKDSSNESEAVVGKRIKLLSPIDGCFYTGTVDVFNSESRTHKITYDNGDVGMVRLDSESWETLNEESFVEMEDELVTNAKTLNSKNCRKEALGACRKTTSEGEAQKLSSNMIPLAAKTRNGQKRSVESSSEAAPFVPRRSTRKKV